METTTPKAGGARPGAGRKRIAPEGAEAVYKLRMSLAQREKLEQLGGARWVREQIDGAKVSAGKG